MNLVELEEDDAIYAVSFPADYSQEVEDIAATETPSQRMAQHANAPDNHPLPNPIPLHYLDFSDVFSKEGFSALPHAKPGITLSISYLMQPCLRVKLSRYRFLNKKSWTLSYMKI